MLKRESSQSAVKSRLWTDVAFDQDGRHTGYVSIPTSFNEAGYAYIPVPITVIRNGEGPSVLLIAGNHGDEYEGQIILLRLTRQLQAQDIKGTLIIMPGLNAPAVEAGARVSPVDGCNLNRAFPGNPRGTATEMLAHYVESELLPKVDYVFDLHSGGKSSDYLTSAVVCFTDDPEKHEATLGLLATFGMPFSLIVEGSAGDDTGMVAACQRVGVARISTELRGGGTVSREALGQAEQGLLRVLHKIGTLTRELASEPPVKTQYLRRLSAKKYIYAKASGLFEPCVDIGDHVETNDLAGLIHFTNDPWREPVEMRFAASGIVIFKRIPGRAEMGQSLFGLATPVEI